MGTAASSPSLAAAGLGKSRLVREALGLGPSDIVDMHAEPYGASNSYRVVRDPLRCLFGFAGTEIPGHFGEQLRGRRGRRRPGSGAVPPPPR